MREASTQALWMSFKERDVILRGLGWSVTYVSSHHTCQAITPLRGLSPGLRWLVTNSPVFEIASCDLMRSLPRSRLEIRYILSVSDQFSWCLEMYIDDEATSKDRLTRQTGTYYLCRLQKSVSRLDDTFYFPAKLCRVGLRARRPASPHELLLIST